MSHRKSIDRRGFLQMTAVATAMLANAPLAGICAQRSWPIGCFNRAWSKWSYDDALDGIKGAGCGITGLVSTSKDEPFTAAAATPEYLDNLKKRIASRGLVANVTLIRYNEKISVADNITDLRKQIENASRLELKTVMAIGVDNPAHREDSYRLLADAAAQAEKRGIQLVIKPHGGSTAAAEEILRCLEKVAHPNLKVWYDAGNIIYYTGKDPLAELEPIVKHVTGFCAKDCAVQKSEVMCQFGTGKVNFKAIFAKLKAAGFKGPVMIEGVKVGSTAEETTANARENRIFLERALAEV